MQEAANTGKYVFGNSANQAGGSKHRNNSVGNRVPIMQEAANTGIYHFVHSADYAGGRKHRNNSVRNRVPVMQEAANTGKYVFGKQCRVGRRQQTQEQQR